MADTQTELEPGEAAMSADTDIKDLLQKLDVAELRPDAEEDEEDEQEDGGSSLSSQDAHSTTGENTTAPALGVTEADIDIGVADAADSSGSPEDEEKALVKPNGAVAEEKRVDKPIGSVSVTVDKDAQNKAKKKKKKGPLEFLKRRLSKENQKPTVTTRIQSMMAVQVDSLPQVFVTKYLGRRVCGGLWGIKHTRGPVDELVRAVQHMPERELPLVQLQVSEKGIYSTLHSQNKAEVNEVDEKEGASASAEVVPGEGFHKGLLPIEFVSYAVQDTKFTRVFSLIVVRELSWRQKTLECLAYVLDSSMSSRRLALSVAMAFKQYAKALEGKPYKFQVDLRPPHELEKELDKKDAECEA